MDLMIFLLFRVPPSLGRTLQTEGSDLLRMASPSLPAAFIRISARTIRCNGSSESSGSSARLCFHRQLRGHREWEDTLSEDYNRFDGDICNQTYCNYFASQLAPGWGQITYISNEGHAATTV